MSGFYGARCRGYRESLHTYVRHPSGRRLVTNFMEYEADFNRRSFPDVPGTVPPRFRQLTERCDAEGLSRSVPK